jgi:hypothetical protein
MMGRLRRHPWGQFRRASTYGVGFVKRVCVVVPMCVGLAGGGDCSRGGTGSGCWASSAAQPHMRGLGTS